ncbi:Ff.00g105540.m01.CDS01 [Fusarium sp. VM40]|nr:Ff.00g105540.m01.CDS01 [Fusarium sp. VM40]
MSHLIGYNLGALHQASRELNTKITTKYYPSASSIDKNPIIPSPGIFDQLNDSHQDNLPTPAQCAVHLELLEVFHALRIKILDSKELDEIFELGDATKTVYRTKYVEGLNKTVNQEVTLRNTVWEQNRDKKWTFYLGKAVPRFLVWADEYNTSLASKLSKDGVDDGRTEIPLTETSWLPPVDVLMVWHAFLLNPSDFLDYCKKTSWNYLQRVIFPWKLIHRVIRSQGTIRDAWAYEAKSWEVPKSNSSISGNLLKSIIAKGKEETLRIDEPFSSWAVKQLVDNVERQRVFVQKMNAHLWIRSPALQGTLKRAVERYDRYLQLFRLYPGKMLVPTLDIDLVWHTSQLSPAAYKASVEARCGRFINHDDKIAKHKLVVGNDETQNLYRIRFGLEYSVCLCWECQAVMSAVEDSDRDGDVEEMRSEGFEGNLADRILEDVKYFRSVESARRRNHVKLPVREDWPLVN